MGREDREAIEASLGALHAQGDHGVVARRLVEAYGPEVIGFLTVTLGRVDQAQDVFQLACEDVLRGLPNFRREASFRTWLYAIARNRAAKMQARARPHVPLSWASAAAERLAALARTSTAPYLRTDVKDRVRALREELSEQERELLVLRVDRGMEWPEIARIVEPEGADDAKVAARLRKQFQRTKARLRDLAERSGLLGADEDGEGAPGR